MNENDTGDTEEILAITYATRFLREKSSQTHRSVRHGLDRLPFSLMPAVAEAIYEQNQQLLTWVFKQIASNYHGCFSGDCPHQLQSDCNEALLAEFWEEREEAKKQ